MGNQGNSETANMYSLASKTLNNPEGLSYL